MKNVYLFQVPVGIDEKMPVHFPYSVGLIWAYAQQFDVINQNYNLSEIIFLREDPNKIIERMQNPSVVGFSCYVWNMNYSMTMAKAIKKKWPNCKIIVGGPQVPAKDKHFFDKHSYCDIAVYREGELVFKEILEQLASDTPDLTGVQGIAVNVDGKTLQTQNAGRTDKLDDIPSPYLLGLFDGMQEKCEELGIVAINALLETNRGCPYKCTYCDWGNGALGKVKKFDLRRVKKELLWFAKNQVEYIVNCDANFGIFKERDLELTKFMIKLKKRYGYPQTFDTNWPKNQNSQVVELAKMLMEAGMLKRFTASIQSGNADTLVAIKRKNLPNEQIGEVISYAKSKGIHTNVELIMGLPNDTYESFQKDFVSCIDRGAYPSIGVLTILPNSEMAEPEYRKRYQIQTKKNVKKFMYVDEEDEFVIATSTMSKNELERLILYCWFVAQFHFQGYTDIFAEFMYRRYSMPITKFYDEFLNLTMIDNDLYPNKEISPFKNHVDKGLTVKLDLGVQNMPIHTLLGHEKRYETYKGFQEILYKMIPTQDHGIIKDLIILQEASQHSLYRESISYIDLKHNLYEYIYDNQELCESESKYMIEQKDVKIRNYGEFMVMTRFDASFKTKILATS